MERQCSSSVLLVSHLLRSASWANDDTIPMAVFASNITVAPSLVTRNYQSYLQRMI